VREWSVWGRDIEGKAAVGSGERAWATSEFQFVPPASRGAIGQSVDDGELRPEGGRAVVAGVSLARIL